MYTLVLDLHSWLRWLALVAGIAATVAAMSAPDSGRPHHRADTWGMVFMMLLDVQLLLGLVLYLVLSPFTREALNDFGAAMKNAGLRFFAVEHVTLMLGAVLVAHLGRVLARKARTPEAKRGRLLLSFGLATLLMIIGIPWPGLAAGRPLFRI
jgi:hypothetical protein